MWPYLVTSLILLIAFLFYKTMAYKIENVRIAEKNNCIERELSLRCRLDSICHYRQNREGI